MSRLKTIFILLTVFLMATRSVFACAACFGASDSAMAQGMNWGIFSLLAVVVAMLSGIAGFFVFLAKKSAQAQLMRPLESEKN
ncbi:MAG: hypothetical protein ABJC04_00665 [Verrucomicrobiota bacterium]